MSDDIHAPPPTYTEVVEKTGHPPPAPIFAGQTTMYTAPAPNQVHAMKYQQFNPTMPTAYGVQVVPLATFTRIPVQCTCANCRSMIITRVEETNGLLTWLLCLLLVLFGCWLGCCLIPFCISDLHNVQHYCPNCNALLVNIVLCSQ